MGSQSNQKNKPETFAYSWFMPAPGGETEPRTGMDETAEAGSGKSGDQTGYVTEVPAQPSDSTEKKQPFSGVLGRVQPKIIGLIAWSGVAATGMALLLTRSGPFPGLLVGALAGVWAAVAAIIWLLPSNS